MSELTPFERAEYILAAIDRRHDARLESGNIGEWQTELNEVRRFLHCLMQHLSPDDKPAN